MLLVSQDQSIAAVKPSNEMNILFNKTLCGPAAIVVEAASDDFRLIQCLKLSQLFA